MQAKEFRRMARENLKNRWMQAVLIMLVFFACSLAISFVLAFIPFIGGFASYVITPVLSFGLLKHLINFKNGENVGYIDFLKLGFDNFVMVWKVTLRVLLKILVPMILMVAGLIIAPSMAAISTMTGGDVGILSILAIIVSLVGMIWLIPVSYKYICAMNELAYDSERSSKEIVEKTGEYMMGNRLSICILQLSFIGWYILAGFTCGIGSFWLVPYMQIATIFFYESVSGRLNSQPSVEDTVVSTDSPIY